MFQSAFSTAPTPARFGIHSNHNDRYPARDPLHSDKKGMSSVTTTTSSDQMSKNPKFYTKNRKIKSVLKMRSLNELIVESRYNQAVTEGVMESLGIALSLVKPKPISDSILVKLLRVEKLNSESDKTENALVVGQIDGRSRFEKNLKELDSNADAALLKKGDAVKSTFNDMDSLTNGSLTDIPTTEEDYQEFWGIVTRLAPRALRRDAEDLGPYDRVRISLNWLATQHAISIGNGVNIRELGNSRTILITLEQYVRIAQTTVSVLLNDPTDHSYTKNNYGSASPNSSVARGGVESRSNSAFPRNSAQRNSQPYLNHQDIHRNVRVPHVALWTVFEATRCLESDVLDLICDLAQKAKRERRSDLLNTFTPSSDHQGFQDFLSLSNITIQELDGLICLSKLLASLCDKAKETTSNISTFKRASRTELDNTLASLRKVLRDTSQNDPLLPSGAHRPSLMHNPMGGLLVSLVDPTAPCIDSVAWPTVSLYNVGKLKRRTQNMNVEVILRDFVTGWPWYRLFRCVNNVTTIESSSSVLLRDMKQAPPDESKSADESAVSHMTTLFNDIMQWHKKGVPSFTGIPFCSPSTFASLLTIVGRSDLGLSALLEPVIKTDARLVSDIHLKLIEGNPVQTADLLIRALASPIIYTPGLPEKLDPAILWTRKLLRDYVNRVLNSGDLPVAARADLERMVCAVDVFEHFLIWPAAETLSFMGETELVPLDKDTYLGWALIEPSLGLRLLEVYVYAMHRTYTEGYWWTSSRINQLRTMCYHLLSMCDIITQTLGPEVHQNSALSLSDQADILEQIKSRVTHINVYASGKAGTNY